MQEKKKFAYCNNCKTKMSYTVKKEVISKFINGRSYFFLIDVAHCDKCGEEITVPRLLKRNAEQIDAQYRKTANIVTVEEIKSLVEKKSISSEELSKQLGFAENTIDDYLNGELPTKENSEIIKLAINDFSPTL